MKTKTRNIQKISEDILKMLVKNKGVEVQITADKTQILICIHQNYTEDFKLIEEVETEKDFLISPSFAGLQMLKTFSETEEPEPIKTTEEIFINAILENPTNQEEPETSDPYRKFLIRREAEKRIKQMEEEEEKKDHRDFMENHFIICKPTPDQQKEEVKEFFDKLSDDLKMIRLKGGKNKDKQRADLLNFVC